MQKKSNTNTMNCKYVNKSTELSDSYSSYSSGRQKNKPDTAMADDTPVYNPVYWFITVETYPYGIKRK